jgi:putative endonuclease
MKLHLERGKEGEQLATRYLEKLGFEIHFCNWRHRHWEIDIVATKDDVVHFIEVKTRHSLVFGNPEEAVSKVKFQRLKMAAAAFMAKYPVRKRIQFDVISILRINDRPIEYFFIEDVYL